MFKAAVSKRKVEPIQRCNDLKLGNNPNFYSNQLRLLPFKYAELIEAEANTGLTQIMVIKNT
jgi:hypothetical protein